MRRIVLVLVASLFCALVAVARQAPAPPPESPASSLEENLQEILEEPTAADTYRYDPQGRRDPFRSLIGPTRPTERGNRPEGVPGFLVDEINVQGVVQTRAGMVALIKGSDNKGYLVRAGDKLYDGEVLRIDRTAVVFRQEVNDPTRIERFREVVKELVPESRRNRP
ncbi:MAG TPA: pilus assembly protein PilP [Thermoanaerobaculia bacterium]|nr:pilus assembly protein PilP [Thermoanaerobaculia bacterium]